MAVRSHATSIACTSVAISALMLLCAPPARADTVQGTVREIGTNNPIPEAIVTLQATATRTTTDANGDYTLVLPDSTDLKIVAAKKRYFNRAGTVDATAPVSGFDLLLEPVPQDDDPTYFIQEPGECASCHPDQYNQWLDTPMHRAGRNTWVHDIYNGTGTAGGMGGFVYTNDSVFAGSNPESECASCHQPEVWIPGLPDFLRMENPNDTGYPSDQTMHGISCETCHKIAHVEVANVNYPGIFPGGVEFTRPAGPEYHQVQYGVLGDTDYTQPLSMRASYNPQLVAETCAVCHQDAADPYPQDHSFDGVISEPSYLEWLASPYGDPASPSYASCVDCHMPPSGEDRACTFIDLPRDPDTLRSHTILGTTPQYLENAAELTVESEVIGDELHVQVEVFNAYTGHHLPTGVTVRNMILLVEAVRESDGSALEFTGDQVIHDLGGTAGTPAEGYYGGLPGKFFAKVNHDATGAGPTFFTDATGIQFDSRIPALHADTTSYSFLLPETGDAVRVRARLIYRRAFRFLVDAKQWTEDGHGNPLADVAPPHYGHLMEDVEVLVTCGPEDLDDSLDVGFSDLMQLVSAWGPCVGCPEDLNGNGFVDFADILDLLAVWGPCP